MNAIPSTDYSKHPHAAKRFAAEVLRNNTSNSRYFLLLWEHGDWEEIDAQYTSWPTFVATNPDAVVAIGRDDSYFDAGTVA